MESRRQCKTIRFIGANEVVIVPIRLNYCGGSAVAMDVEKFSVSTKLSKVLVGPISISNVGVCTYLYISTILCIPS